MKSHSFIRELSVFLTVLIFFALPPVFSNIEKNPFQIESYESSAEKIEFFEWNFPFEQMIFFAFAFCLYFFCKKFDEEKIQEESQNLLNSILILAFSLILLLLISFLLQKFASFFNLNNSFKVNLPDSLLNFIFCILNFTFSAFYEETIYRYFFPSSLKKLLENFIKNQKILKFICEIFPAILFSLAHLYSGIFSAINAIFAHIILRICYKKTKNIIFPAICHGLYNFVSLFISVL